MESYPIPNQTGNWSAYLRNKKHKFNTSDSALDVYKWLSDAKVIFVEGGKFRSFKKRGSALIVKKPPTNAIPSSYFRECVSHSFLYLISATRHSHIKMGKNKFFFSWYLNFFFFKIKIGKIYVSLCGSCIQKRISRIISRFFSPLSFLEVHTCDFACYHAKSSVSSLYIFFVRK